jgi:hypothetical protein
VVSPPKGFQRDVLSLQSPGQHSSLDDRTFSKEDQGRFSGLVTQYQLAVAQSGMTNNIAIIDSLCRGLDKELVQMVLSMKDPPKGLKEWSKEVSEFHTQQQCIGSTMTGHRSVGSVYTSKTSRHDPNTILTLCLSPVEHMEHMRKNQCFICHKVGCSTCSHQKDGRNTAPASFPHPYCPPQVQAVEMTSPPAPSPLATYIQGLKGKNIGADKIL